METKLIWVKSTVVSGSPVLFRLLEVWHSANSVESWLEVSTSNDSLNEAPQWDILDNVPKRERRRVNRALTQLLAELAAEN